LDLDYIELLELAVIVAIKDKIEYISAMAAEMLMIDKALIAEGVFFSDLFIAEDPRHPIVHIIPLDTDTWSTGVKTLRKNGLINQHMVIRGLILDRARDKVIYTLDFAGFNPKRRQSDIMTTVVASSPVSIMITDLRGIIVYVNDKFEEWTGYTKEEAIGYTPAILKSGVHPRRFYDALWQTIRCGAIWKGVFYNKKKDGHFIWEEASIQPLKGYSGRIEYYLAIKEDITERKHLEEELQDKNTSLLQALKILQDTQAQMIQQEKMASVGQLAAGVAHEINNPLGFITSNVSTLADYVIKMRHYITNLEEMILEEKQENLSARSDRLKSFQKQDHISLISEDIMDLLSDVESGLERVGKIVQGLRNFSRIDQMSELANYDLNEGISTTLLVANNEIKYDAEVHCILTDDLPLVMANGGQINQVILNLLLNAVQAVRESKINGTLGTITIETFRSAEYATLRISDDGPGMSVNTLNRLFEPFYTTKPPGLGTGLGLSICYDIVVHKHKGILKASNNVDKGANFEMSLPIGLGGEVECR
jgi:PAS domain S-box-containing protein